MNWLAISSAGFYLAAVPLLTFVQRKPVMASLIGLAVAVVALSLLLGNRVRREDKVAVVFSVGERLVEPSNLFHVRVSDADIRRVTLTQAARLMVGKPFVRNGMYRIRQSGQDGGVTFLSPNAIDSLPMLEWKIWVLYAGYVGERLVMGSPSSLQGPEVRGADALILQAMSLRGDDPSLLAPRNERERVFLATRIKLERRRYLDALEAFFRTERNLSVLKAIQKQLANPGIPEHETVKNWMTHVTLPPSYPLAVRKPAETPAAKKPAAVPLPRAETRRIA